MMEIKYFVKIRATYFLYKSHTFPIYFEYFYLPPKLCSSVNDNPFFTKQADSSNNVKDVFKKLIIFQDTCP